MQSTALCLLLVLLGAALAYPQSSNGGESKEGAPPPFMMNFTEYGEGSRDYPAVCRTLADFRERRVRFPFKHDHPVDPVTRLDRVGQIGDREIYEVSYLTKRTYTYNDRPYNSYILVHVSLVRWGTGNTYCAFRASSIPKDEAEEDKDKLPLGTIVQIDEPLYILLIRTPGTGYNWDESYYAFDGPTPVSLELDQQAATLASRFLPKGCTVRKGGSFCHQHMEWRSALWREGDSECCPSCGAVSVRFRYAKRKLQLIDHSVYLDFNAMSEIRPARGCRQ